MLFAIHHPQSGYPSACICLGIWACATLKLLHPPWETICFMTIGSKRNVISICYRDQRAGDRNHRPQTRHANAQKHRPRTSQRPQTPLSRLLSRPMRPPGNLKNESTPDGGCSTRIIFKLTRMDIIIMSVHEDLTRTRPAAQQNLQTHPNGHHNVRP